MSPNGCFGRIPFRLVGCVYRALGCRSRATFVWDEHAAKIFQRLELTRRELTVLAKFFDRADHDQSGSISVSEFCAAADIYDSAFMLRVFSLMDIDG